MKTYCLCCLQSDDVQLKETAAWTRDMITHVLSYHMASRVTGLVFNVSLELQMLILNFWQLFF